MTNRISLLQAVEITKAQIKDVTFMCLLRTKVTYFTRGGKMEFNGDSKLTIQNDLSSTAARDT